MQISLFLIATLLELKIMRDTEKLFQTLGCDIYSRADYILDENGDLLLAGDNDRRFFEAAWLHKYKGKYYFSYSTGDTHFICYAIGDNPYGPFTYKGKILNPVVGWTSHHSICEFKGKWYLFYHDSSLSKGVTHLRSVKIAEIQYDEDGLIKTLQPYNGFSIL